MRENCKPLLSSSSSASTSHEFEVADECRRKTKMADPTTAAAAKTTIDVMAATLESTKAGFGTSIDASSSTFSTSPHVSGPLMNSGPTFIFEAIEGGQWHNLNGS